MDWQNIIVSSKILGHISAGVYRSPAGAIKELVSNAFDANATRVAITTNWPSFDIITCRDNGSGITPEQFRLIMQGGIGDSTKRVDSDGGVVNIDPKFNRPIIGWLGIGMLGVAQICHEFKIISHHRETKTAFQATIKLMDFLREKVGEIDPEKTPEQRIDVGQFSIEEIDYNSEEVGTYIITSAVRSAFVRKFREKSGPEEDPLPLKMAAFLDEIRQRRSIKELSDYWQMIWELMIACPIPYIDNGPFNWDNITVEEDFKEQLQKRIQQLKDYRFEVIVDGLSLRKPNFYPFPLTRRRSDVPMTGKIFPLQANETVYGRPLKLSGYLYLQDGQAIEPLDLAGILVRIRNIAIGGYDPTFFKYPQIQNFRFNWISGEIYIEEGLEYALNIDRDSFNEMHPHFVKFQQIVHDGLTQALSEARKSQARRSQTKDLEQKNEREKKTEQFIKSELNNYKLVRSDQIERPVEIDTEKRSIMINDQSPLLPKSKGKQNLIKQIMLAFELAMLAPEEQRKERFQYLLLELVEQNLL